VHADELEALGLGLRRGVVVLSPANPAWIDAAQRLIEAIWHALDHNVTAVEHIGSTAVAGLLAKPILDIAAAAAPATSSDDIVEPLVSAGWEFRGDAGGSGGLVFVLSVRPDHRVAHLHVVGADDPQWAHYLALRDRLRSDPAARAAYEEVKRQLAQAHPADRAAYTDGKDEIVRRLRRLP